MNTISIHKTIKLTFTLDGYEQYCFGEDKNLYNVQRGKQIKHTIVNSTKGWCICGKFMSEKKLRPLLKRIPKIENLPF